MPSFPKPVPALNYSLAAEKQAIDQWFQSRSVPQSMSNRLLLGSWNIANLGEQKRDQKDLNLIAHILSRFDLIAVQEVKTDVSHLRAVAASMGSGFDWIVNDPGGNSERLAFIYRKSHVQPGRLFGEVAIPEKDFPVDTIVVPYRKSGQDRIEVYYNLRFTPFDRNPFVGTFTSGNLTLTLANVHLYFGAFKDASSVVERAKYARRVMEVLTLAEWAKERRKDQRTLYPDIVLLGDMNVPEMNPTDAAFRALLKSGLEPAEYSTTTGGSNLGGTKTYDQLAITPGDLVNRRLKYDVFDFDNAVFASKWNQLSQQLTPRQATVKFNAYVRFHVSDHRLLWMQFKTD